MRILFIVNKIEEGKDGVGDYTLKLAEQFRLHSHETFFLSSSASEKEQRSDAFFVVGNWGWHSISFIMEITDKLKPDWVIVQYVPFAFHKRGFPLWLCALLIRFRFGRVKIAIFFHEIADRFYFPSGKRILSSLLNRIIGNLLYSLSHKSWASIAFYHRYFMINPDLIPIGSNIKLRGVSEKKRVNDIITLSTFGIRNALYFKILIDAAEILVGKDLGFNIKVLGTIPEKEQTISLIASKGLTDHFYFSGFVTEGQIELELISSDIFINLNGADHLGRGGTCLKSGSLAAGFAAGLSVIGFRGDMTDEVLRNGDILLLCDETSGMCLAKKIEMLLTDSSLRNRLQDSAIRFYEKELRWPLIYSRWMLGLTKVN